MKSKRSKGFAGALFLLINYFTHKYPHFIHKHMHLSTDAVDKCCFMWISSIIIHINSIFEECLFKIQKLKRNLCDKLTRFS
jgi:hypothetical protein